MKRIIAISFLFFCFQITNSMEKNESVCDQNDENKEPQKVDVNTKPSLDLLYATNYLYGAYYANSEESKMAKENHNYYYNPQFWFE